jgi:putative membrane protein
MPLLKKHSPLYIALLFHVSGLIGILCSPYKDLFVQSTPIVLLTMFILLTYSQIKLAQTYFVFFLIAFAIGMVTEIIGVNTGLLFGNYQYGEVLGPKVYGVPLLIGFNWFFIVFCASALITQCLNIITTKFNLVIPASWFSIAVVIGGAAIATCFDLILEPVAIKLHFWSWQNDHIPAFNYTCWFVISAFLLGIKMYLKKFSNQPFATGLLIIQALFFLVLNLFL